MQTDRKQLESKVSVVCGTAFRTAVVCRRRAGRTLNQLTTLRSSELRADWLSSSKGGSPQSRGIPRGKFPTHRGYVKHTLPYPLQRFVTSPRKIKPGDEAGGGVNTIKFNFKRYSNEGKRSLSCKLIYRVDVGSLYSPVEWAMRLTSQLQFTEYGTVLITYWTTL